MSLSEFGGDSIHFSTALLSAASELDVDCDVLGSRTGGGGGGSQFCWQMGEAQAVCCGRITFKINSGMATQPDSNSRSEPSQQALHKWINYARLFLLGSFGTHSRSKTPCVPSSGVAALPFLCSSSIWLP